MAPPPRRLDTARTSFLYCRVNSSTVDSDNVGGFAHDLSALVVELVENAFGPAVTNVVFGTLRLEHLIASAILVALVVLVDAVLFGLLRRWIRKGAVEGQPATTLQLVLHAVGRPLHVTIWAAGLYLACTPLLMGWEAESAIRLQLLMSRALGIVVLLMTVWLFLRLTGVLEKRMQEWAAKSESRLDDLVVPLAVKCLRVIVPVMAIILALPAADLPEAYHEIVSKVSSLLVIGAVAWVLFQGVRLTEQVLVSRFDINVADNLRAREVYTQVTVLKKTLYVIIAIFTIASVLMLFEEVRRFGTSILASAGIAGIIIGFAAQRTISNLFAGFQLAITQPIRIDDVVIVENEWGRVEEITLTYVVVRIWDLRRLIVPITYFIEKPFQNWTRVSADILGSVMLYADYTLPIEPLRKELRRIVEQAPNWDKKVCVLQVTNATEKTLELRALISAPDAGKAWDLRCEIREKLLGFIQSNFPACLPKVRAELGEGGGEKRLANSGAAAA